ETSPLLKTTAFVACCAIWGSTFLFIRIGNDVLPPFWAAAMRLALATVILSLVVVATRQPWPRGAALKSTLQFGFFQFGVNLPFLYWGETRVSSGLSAVFFATIPLTSALLARGFGLEKLQRGKIVGALLALAGAGILFSGQIQAHVPPLALLAV